MRKEDIQFVFIGGCPRSGTSLVKRILDAHSDIFCGPEFGHLPGIIEHYTVMKRGIAQDRLSTYFDKEKLKGIYQEFIPTFFGNVVKQNGVNIIAEKTPDNIFAFAGLYELFPNAKFIEVIRNPLDVVASYQKVGKRKQEKQAAKTIDGKVHIGAAGNKGPATPFNSPLEAARRWRRSVHYLDCTPGLKVDKLFRKNLLQIYYEDLVTAPEKIVRKMCRHIGCDYSDAMLVTDGPSSGDPKGFGGEFYLASEYFRAIDTSRLGIWKRELTQVEVNMVVNELRSEMRYHNYLLM